MTDTRTGRGRLMSVEDLADLCGVSTATIHQWLWKGTAPRSLKIGRHRRFMLEDVEAWLEARADQPRPAA